MNTNFFNLTKKQKKDLLFELLSGKSHEGIVSKKELNALNRLIEGAPSKKAPAKLNDQPSKTKKVSPVTKKTKTAKIKTTQHLPQETVKNLDKALNAIRSHVPKEKQALITKSLVVDKAMALLVQELTEKGKKSRLLRNILQNI